MIVPLDRPLGREGGTVILQGNLCPDGAVLKQTAASPHLLRHRGRAVVFESKHDLMARVNDPALEVDETSVLVQKLGGPRGGPGMPEWGAAPDPGEASPPGREGHGAGVGRADERDVVRHRASSTSRRSPRSAARSRSCGTATRSSWTCRRGAWSSTCRTRSSRAGGRAWTPPPPAFTRGYGKLYLDHVLQAPDGADFDFLRGGPGPGLEALRAHQPLMGSDFDFQTIPRGMTVPHREIV